MVLEPKYQHMHATVESHQSPSRGQETLGYPILSPEWHDFNSDPMLHRLVHRQKLHFGLEFLKPFHFSNNPSLQRSQVLLKVFSVRAPNQNAKLLPRLVRTMQRQRQQRSMNTNTHLSSQTRHRKTTESLLIGRVQDPKRLVRDLVRLAEVLDFRTVAVLG